MNSALAILLLLATPGHSSFIFSDISAIEMISQEIFYAYTQHCAAVILPPDATAEQVSALHFLVKNLSKGNSKYPTAIPVMSYDLETYKKRYINDRFRFNGPCTTWLSINIVTDSTNSYLAQITDIQFPKAFWLLFANGSIDELFKGVTLTVKSKVWIIHPGNNSINSTLNKLGSNVTANCSEYSIYEAYRVGEQPIRILFVGCWSYEDGLVLVEKRSRKVLRHDFKGQILRAGAIEMWPLVGFTDDEDNGRRLDGFLPQVWYQLEEILRFSTTVSKAPYSSGMKMADGRWSGLIGKALDGEIDAMIVDMDFAEGRVEVVDFLLPILTSDFQVFFKRKKVKKVFDITAIFRPLHYWVWFCLAGVVILSAIVHYFINRVFQRLEIEESREFSMVSSFYFAVQALCVQGTHHVPKRWASRLVFIVCYLTASIILPIYSASLISSLTKSRPKAPFDHLQGIWTTDYKVIIPDNTSYYEFFEKNDDEKIRAIIRDRRADIGGLDLYSNATTTFEFLCSAKHMHVGLFTTDGALTDYFRDKNRKICPMQTMKHPAAKVYSSMAMPKHSQYSSALNYNLLKMLETGVIKRIKSKFLKKFYEDPPVKKFELSLNHVSEIFIILGLSMVLAVLMLFTEIYCWREKRAKDAQYSTDEK